MTAPALPPDLLVFISYRREDSAGHAGRLFDDLARRFPPEQLFMDVDAIRPGEDFAATITDAVARSQALVALIGPRWLSAADADGRRRLDDDRDYVRLEIETALERDILVIPVLLQDARMPKQADLPLSLKPFAKRNSIQLRDASWRNDVKTLATGLDRLNAAATTTLRGHSEAFWTAAPGEVELPYLGLRAFEEDDARFYFGREDDVAQLLERLAARRFLAVFGPSGSGKSSLVRAGLTKALHDGAIKGSDTWPVAILRPGPRPLDTLAAWIQRLVPGRSMAELVDSLAADPRTLHLETTRALAERPGADRIVWVIDQAEELFTLCNDEKQRSAAIANIVHAGTIEGGSADVVFAMRADFYQRCAIYPELAAAISASQHLVSPMSEAGLRRAIEGPAEVVGLSFEPGLVDTIIDDVSAQPGGLPLLEYALFELFQRRRGTTLTLEGYRATGGVEGALAKRAESVYHDLGEVERDLVRRVMLRLTQPGEGTVDTRRRSSLRDLPSGPGEADPVRYVVDELADARLVTLGAGEGDSEPVVEIAHEALLRAWPRVREWIDQDREAIRVQRRIADAAAEWQRIGKADDALLRGVRLAEATDWQANQPGLLNDSERAFVTASSIAAESESRASERRRRVTLSIATALTLVFVILTGLTFVAWRGSEDARTAALSALADTRVAEQRANDTITQLEAKQIELDRERRTAIGRGLVSEARRPTTTYAQSILLALEARKLAGADANTALLERVTGWARLIRTVPIGGPSVDGSGASAVSPDLRFTARDERATVVLREIATGRSQTLGSMAFIDRMRFSPDGSRLFVSGGPAGGEAGGRIWHVDRPDDPPLTITGTVASWSFSGDGSVFAVATAREPGSSEAHLVTVWRIADGAVIRSVELDDRIVASVALNGRGNLLAVEGVTASDELEVTVWDVESGSRTVVPVDRTPFPSGPPWERPAIAFSAAQDIVAIPRGDGVFENRIVLWDVARKPVRLFDINLFNTTIGEEGRIGHVAEIAFSPDGRSLAIPSGATLSLETADEGWNVDVGHSTRNLSTPLAGLHGAIFTPDGGSVLARSEDGHASVWTVDGPDVPSQQVALADTPPRMPRLLAVHPDGARIVVSIEPSIFAPDPFGETRVEIVDVGTGRARYLGSERGTTAAFSADGQLIAIGTGEGVRVVRDADLEQVKLLSTDQVTSIALSSDGSKVALTSRSDEDGALTLRTFEVASGAELEAAPLERDAAALAFNSDSSVLAVAFVGDGPEAIEAWDAGRLTTERIVVAEASGVHALAYSATDDILVATTRDGVVAWSADAGVLLSLARTNDIVEGRGDEGPRVFGQEWVVSASGGYVGSMGWDGWVYRIEDILVNVEEVGCGLAGRNLSAEEWARYLPDEPFAATCPELPGG